jgi:hypothetical protein
MRWPGQTDAAEKIRLKPTVGVQPDKRVGGRALLRLKGLQVWRLAKEHERREEREPCHDFHGHGDQVEAEPEQRQVATDGPEEHVQQQVDHHGKRQVAQLA